jgi:hypothetical protein
MTEKGILTTTSRSKAVVCPEKGLAQHQGINGKTF